MNTCLKKNYLTKPIGVAFAVSAGILLNFPAGAIANSNPSASNQFNNRTPHTDSTARSQKILAQGTSRTQPTIKDSDLEPGTWLCLNNPNPKCRR